VRGSLRVSALAVLILALLAAGVPITAGAPIAPVAATSARASAPTAVAVVAPAASLARSESPPSAAPTAPPIETPAEVASPPAPTETTAPAITALYRVTIPRLGINLLIKEGDITRDIVDQHTPENYAFHLPGTLWPGQGGNTYLYAHARVGMFLSLWNARPGDEVFVTAPDGQLFPYVIRDVLPRVAPTDVSSTRPTTTERLTLQTSTGPNGSDPRFVVFAFPRNG
jgi:sortase (surface protein transpeptidase)